MLQPIGTDIQETLGELVDVIHEMIVMTKTHIMYSDTKKPLWKYTLDEMVQLEVRLEKLTGRYRESPEVD